MAIAQQAIEAVEALVIVPLALMVYATALDIARVAHGISG
jgi:hypothetical protein